MEEGSRSSGRKEIRHKLKGRNTSYSNERMGENTERLRRGECLNVTVKGAYEMVSNLSVKEELGICTKGVRGLRKAIIFSRMAGCVRGLK